MDVYAENGPTSHWEPTLFDPFDPFKQIGYLALLLGQKIPFQRTYWPTPQEIQTWEAQRRQYKEIALRSMSIKEALAAIRHPKWKWIS